MKVYTKIIFNKNNEIIYEESYNYKGSWSCLGIHYDYKSTRGAKAMEKQAKREKKLAEKRAKKQAKSEPVSSKEDRSIPLDQVITLDHLTNPDKK